MGDPVIQLRVIIGLYAEHQWLRQHEEIKEARTVHTALNKLIELYGYQIGEVIGEYVEIALPI